LLLAAGLFVGCGGAADPAATPRIACTDVPDVKCDEAVAAVARSMPNEHPVVIEVLCVSAPCTESSGAMQTIVTLADGNHLRGTPQAWADPAATDGGPVQAPPPAGPGRVPLPVEPICQGVPIQSCRDMASGVEDANGARTVVSIVVRCTKGPCTDKSGEGETKIIFSDGSQQTGGWSYASGG